MAFSRLRAPGALVPGVLLTGALGVVAWWGARALAAAFPHAAVDAVVLAIVGGMLVRAWWVAGSPSCRSMAFSTRPRAVMGEMFRAAAISAAAMPRA